MIDNFGCVGNTIKVAAGHYVDLARPNPESIDLRTIAAALSKLCRFGCHCPRFYSVAEHCVHATELAAEDGIDGNELLTLFLHDAAEAYVGDVVKPLKVMLPDYAIVEGRMEKAIESRFGVDFTRYHGTVKLYDRLMLKAEKTSMWPDDSEQWAGFHNLPERDVPFQFWSPELAEMNFLNLANELGGIT